MFDIAAPLGVLAWPGSGEAGGDPYRASVVELLACDAGERGTALAESTPGPEVLQALAFLDPALLDAAERVDHLIAWERCAAWVAGGQARALAALAALADADVRAALADRSPADVDLCDAPADGPPDAAASGSAAGCPAPPASPDPGTETAWALRQAALSGLSAAEIAHLAAESLCAEVGAALRLSPQAAGRRLDVATALAGPLAATGAALAQGGLSYLHAMVIAEGVSALDADSARAVQDRILPAAKKDTVGRLRRRVARAVLAMQPMTADQAHEEARTGRRVRIWDLPDGMAALYAELSAEQAQIAWTAIDTLARRRRDTRVSDGPADSTDDSMDAARADALVDLLAAGLDNPDLPDAASRSAARAAVQITIDLPTLLGFACHPGELAGYGPIPAGMARALAADGTWQRLVTDPQTGALLDYGRRTYRPPAALREFLITRDRTCSFPGCSRAAARCDCDHAVPYDAGGPTSRCNCGMLCRRHHRLKTFTRWRLARQRDGTAEWTSPVGRSYREPPHDHRSEGGSGG